jgi:WD40 repeat protein
MSLHALSPAVCVPARPPPPHLRQVPNLECLCIALAPNGKSIVSGWDDGKIRAFYPQSGRLQYVITDAHAESVTAIAITHDSGKLVSGGSDGRVRVWNVSGSTQVMEQSFKEHKRECLVFVCTCTVCVGLASVFVLLVYDGLARRLLHACVPCSGLVCHVCFRRCDVREALP